MQTRKFLKKNFNARGKAAGEDGWKSDFQEALLCVADEMQNRSADPPHICRIDPDTPNSAR